MARAAFDDLTAVGQVRRLHRLVPLAMAHHDVEVARVRLAARAYNTTFRIDASDGRRFALRVGAPRHLNVPRSAEIEAVWTDALAHDTPLRPPAVVRARDGAAAVRVAVDGVPGVRECVLFTWQEGRSLRGRLDDADLVAAMGEVLALLHAHATDFADVSADEVLHGDRVCYLRVPDALSDDGSLLAEGVAWAQEGLDALWRTRGGAAHLCHGDLHPNNVLIRHRRVVPVDFQDAMWGLEEQDIAITLVMLAREDPSGTAAAALRRGYERHRAWPAVAPATMDLLMIVRRLHIVNVLTAVRPAMVPPFRAAVLHDLRRVLGDQR